ncbi:MAG: hypothetical protein HPY68_03970 [Candidatus Atribacteria bacterium]|nr:hypothetical protein [Candidatus Atribacteria bacterium]
MRVKNWFAVLLVTLLVALLVMCHGCAKVCPTWGQFCVAVFGSISTPVGANVCPSEVHICPGETATLYWNVSEDVTKVTITSEFGSVYGPFTVRTGSQNVSPPVTTRYTMKAEGDCPLEKTVTVNVVRGGDIVDLIASGNMELGVWTVDVSPVTTSSSIIVSSIKTVTCSTGGFWNKWNCKKTDRDLTPHFLTVTDVDSPTNNIPLVGSWEFTPKEGDYWDSIACFKATIKCQETPPAPSPEQMKKFTP